ncbi:hypothetical protein Mapa_010664 [Marchantia paleacea]|nr:hypothetical protein Mapa_010664 [Marchantia paleacea]
MTTSLLKTRELDTFDKGGWLSEEDSTQPSSPLSRNGDALRVMVVVKLTSSKDLTMDALEWALINVVQPGDNVTLLGVIPDGDTLCGVNLKVLLQVWLTRLSTCWQGDEEYQEHHQLLEDEITRKKAMFQSLNVLQHFYRICEKKGVNLDVKIAAGVTKHVVTQQAESLQATWVVLDKAFRRNRGYFEHHLLCNMVLMKRSNVGDIVRVYYHY